MTSVPIAWKSDARLGFRSLGWVGVAAALAVAGLGWVGHSLLLFLAGGLIAAALVAVLAPEVVLALFIVAGGLKTNPSLGGLPVDLTLMAGFGVATAILVRELRGRSALANLPAPAALMAALVSLVLLSTLWTRDPVDGIDKALRFETLTLLAFLAPFVLLQTRLALARFAVAIVAFALVMALTAVETGHPSHPLILAGGNEIELGLYTAFALVCITGYLTGIGPWRMRLLWLIPAPYLVITILEAGSRGAVVGSLFALAFIWVRLMATSSRARVMLFAVGAAAAATLMLSGLQVAGGAASKYQDRLLSGDTSQVLGDRKYLYDEGRKLALAHPLGLGVGGFDPGSAEYPHNIVLELSSEEGLTAVGLALALAVAAWRARRRAPGGPGSPEAIFSGALILLMTVEAFVSFDINENRLLWFSLGFALALPRFRADSKPG